MKNSWYVSLLPIIINSLSPTFFKEVDVWIQKLKEVAAKTDNPIDDIFVDLLDRIVNPK